MSKLNFSYQDGEFSARGQVDERTAYRLIEAMRRVVEGTEEDATSYVGQTEFVMDYLNRFPESTWADVREAMLESGYKSPHQGTLNNIIRQGRAMSVEGRPLRYRLTQMGKETLNA